MDISILFQKLSRNLTWAPKHTHKKSDFQKFARVIEDSVNPKNDPLLKKNMKLAYLPNVKPCENKSIEIPKGINKIQVQLQFSVFILDLIFVFTRALILFAISLLKV